MEFKEKSFIKQLETIRPTKKTTKEATPGLKYLHSILYKSAFKGKPVSISDINFNAFTTDDLQSYMEYYDADIKPKIDILKQFISVLNNANAIFSQNRQYY